MRRKQLQTVDAGVVAGPLVYVQRKFLVAVNVDACDPAKRLRITDARMFVTSDLPGKEYIFRCDRCAVAPFRLGKQLIGNCNPRFPVGRRFIHRGSSRQVRQRLAHHANEVPVLIENRDRPAGEGQHVGLGQHTVNQRIEIRRELADPDYEFLRGCLCGGGQRDQNCREEDGEKTHNHQLAWKRVCQDTIIRLS